MSEEKIHYRETRPFPEGYRPPFYPDCSSWKPPWWHFRERRIWRRAWKSYQEGR